MDAAVATRLQESEKADGNSRFTLGVPGKSAAAGFGCESRSVGGPLEIADAWSLSEDLAGRGWPSTSDSEKFAPETHLMTSRQLAAGLSETSLPLLGNSIWLIRSERSVD